ncbi:hypothetical protein DCC79_02415 [bacterium]|nr:MAG: hypothetical protein DCC79_02415 [bacterium]
MRIRWGRVILALLIVLGLCGLGTWFAFQRAGLQVTGIDPGLGGVVAPTATRARGFVPATGEGSAAATAPRAAGTRAVTGAAGARDDSGLPPFRVLTLQYTPYMATLVHMEAGGYLEALGHDLQLFDVYSDAIALDEAGQCEAVRSGEYQALATTVDATRKCGEGVAVGIPIGQSAGNDAIVVKAGVDTWNDIFEHAVAFTGYSVSEYMACFASHSANQPIQLPIRMDDAAAAVDDWINAGAEQNILSVVAWEPEVSRALAAVPGSQVILSSKDVRILWDIVEFSSTAVEREPAAFEAFTRAYYAALRDLTRDPDSALAAMVAWAGDDPGRQALLTTTDAAEFRQQLDSEAFATLRDAAQLMDSRQTLLNRLDEAAFYWGYCGVDVPPVTAVETLIAPQFVQAVKADPELLGQPNERPSAEIFQVTDFTNAAAVTDAQIQQAQVLFQKGVQIEFMANRTDFRDPAAALATLGEAVRFLRTCQDCVLQVQGGAAYPGPRICPTCTAAESDRLAAARGRRVFDELKSQFDVPEAQLYLVEQPHAPQYPGSNDEAQLRQDRQTFLTGYQLGGR